jgi:hypothetical protein
MDYSSLESAKPSIEIYFWGTENIKNYIKYWTSILANKNDLRQFEKWGNSLGKSDIDAAQREKKEREKLSMFQNCHNLTTKIKSDITLIIDDWDEKCDSLKYKVKFELKKGSI